MPGEHRAAVAIVAVETPNRKDCAMKRKGLLRDVYVARYTNEGVLAGTIVRVNPVAGYFTHPVISPDGTRVAYWGRSRSGLHIWVAELLPPGAEPVIPGPGMSCHPAWSPDSSHLVYAHNPAYPDDAPAVSLYDPQAFAPREIWILNMDTGVHRCLKSNGLDNERPAWSPDSRCIAYVAGDQENKNIRIVDLASGEERSVTRMNGVCYRPAWHPGGGHLAFNNKGPRSHYLWMIDVDGCNLRQVTPTVPADVTVHDHGAFWSSDGRTILFHSDRGGKWGLWRIHVDSAEMHPVTVPGIDSIGHATWDAGEEWICFDAGRDESL